MPSLKTWYTILFFNVENHFNFQIKGENNSVFSKCQATILGALARPI